ncbi:hypothetical protein DMH08_18370 [Actinomadura sp. WAC 06369]|nr:hypothetical protein DMH08_18370 [Actinomadura sp. WAC 06369]
MPRHGRPSGPVRRFSGYRGLPERPRRVPESRGPRGRGLARGSGRNPPVAVRRFRPLRHGRLRPRGRTLALRRSRRPNDRPGRSVSGHGPGGGTSSIGPVSPPDGPLALRRLGTRLTPLLLRRRHGLGRAPLRRHTLRMRLTRGGRPAHPGRLLFRGRRRLLSQVDALAPRRTLRTDGRRGLLGPCGGTSNIGHVSLRGGLPDGPLAFRRGRRHGLGRTLLRRQLA